MYNITFIYIAPLKDDYSEMHNLLPQYSMPRISNGSIDRLISLKP